MLSKRAKIRNCREEDLIKLVEIWRKVDLTLGLSDSIEELERLRKKNPRTCLVLEENNQVIAGVLGGFDGRRGLVHHLAVDPCCRDKGYGTALMLELESRFNKMGVVKFSLWIENRNSRAIEFYQHLGYELRDLITMSKTLRNE